MTAYATASGYSQSSTASKSCTYTQPKCATPVISMIDGGRRFSITCSTPGATIHYNCNNGGQVGTSPSPFTSRYFIITTHAEAYATAPGYTQSDTAVWNLGG